ncbi:CBS domain-containing protein [Thiomonas delicata]|uniref:CBS domain-containing protein n=1 Tax=Thiomonas delicata TaxID=364030 RepID=A0A238D0C5_THIDL|nr:MULTISPECIES: CBS domain-containing protein [Thiomonas]SBP86701.1 conserved hypothetical protein [Thiomonas delicata]
MTIYRNLHPKSLPPHARICETDLGRPARVDMDTPATAVMTDLRRVPAVTIAPDATVETAQERMIHARVRLLLVTAPGGEVLGLITARDLLGEKPIRVAVDDGVARDAVTVARVMVPRERIQVLDYGEVQHSSVGDVVMTLREAGRQHALVLEQGPVPVIRGIFSTTQIGRQLGSPIEASERPQSFAEVEHLLAAS